MKMMGAAEFKKHCLRVIDEVNATGEPVTITKRGRPVAKVVREIEGRPKMIFGMLKNDAYRFDDPFSPAYDKPWNAEFGILDPEE